MKLLTVNDISLTCDKTIKANLVSVYSCSHCCCTIFFLTSHFMYRYIMLILINRWLLNLICRMKKAMNGQNSSKQNSQLLLHLSMLFGKPCFSLFSSLLLPFFISSFINFFSPHSSCDCIDYELIKYI